MELKYFYTDMELIGAIFCVIAAVYLVVSRSVIQKQYRALAILEAAVGIMLLFDAFAWYYRGTEGAVAYWIVVVTNCVSFLINPLLQVFFIHYVVLSHKDNKDDFKVIYVVSALAAISVILVIVSQFTGYIYRIDPATNLYERGPGFALHSALILMQSSVSVVYIVRNRYGFGFYRMIALLSFIVLPIIAGTIQIFVYGYSLSNIACIISSLFMFAQALDDNAKTLVNQEIHIKKQDDQLLDMRTKIALSQIRPEFLYDALNAVYNLCDNDANKAKELIVHLENYLRENIESIHTDSLVPFGKELEHTKVFLEIEKFTYKDSFDVEYNIETSDFELPALTVQPIVENALRHGISTLEPGKRGLIKISTTKGNGYVKVEVTDNGAGFDMSDYNRSENVASTRIGIRNVKDRLKVMEDAELHIKSRPGEGTRVDMIIPKR